MVALSDPSAWFLQLLAFSRQLFDYDVGDFEPGLGQLARCSSAFSFSGISLPLSRKVLEKTERVIGRDRPRAWIRLLMCKSIYDYVAGEWDKHAILQDPSLESLGGTEAPSTS